MSKFTSLVRRAPKRFTAALAMVAAAIIVPAAVLAWGPDRPLFTTAVPASYITFNSIKDNPSHGFEPNFVQVREATASNTSYADEISLQSGKEYVMYMYYHNNAASNLNLVAEGSYAKAELPAIVPNGSTGTKANGYVGATNARPTQVFDDVSFKNSTGGDIAIRYVPGSATIHNFGKSDGMTMSDSIITTGAPLGFDQLDGKVPGCNEFAGYVTFRFKADQPNFEIKKQVRNAGTTQWSENVTSKVGDTVDYQLEYKNTGTTEQNNVIIEDQLPKGLDYVAGSTYLVNSSNPSPKNVSDNLVAASGINVGNYKPAANVFLKFSAKVTDKDLVCGTNTLKNVATAQTNNGSKSDDATVTVNKECTPPPVEKDITVCELATKKTITIKESRFDASKHSKNLDDCKVVEVKKIMVCDLTTKQVITINENQFDTTKHSKNLDDCKTPEVKNIKVCELSTKQVITIDEKNFDAAKHSKNLDDCKTPEVKNIKVCELATKKIITIAENQYDATKHSMNLADCKVVEVKTIKVCDLTTKQIVTINEQDFTTEKYSKNLDDCKVPGELTVCEIATKKTVTIKDNQYDETKYTKDLNVCVVTPTTPETPPELPQTGAGEGIVAIVGLGAMIASIGYYVASRRALGL